MKHKNGSAPPPRLADADNELAQALRLYTQADATADRAIMSREASSVSRPPSVKIPPFAQLMAAERSLSQKRVQLWSFTCSATVAVIFLWWGVIVDQSAPAHSIEVQPTIVAENTIFDSSLIPSEQVPTVQRSHAESKAPSPLPSSATSLSPSVLPNPQRKAGLRRVGPTGSLDPKLQTQSHTPKREAQNCGHLGASGQIQEAVDCYIARTEGSDLGAELSYLELARLQQSALGSPQTALARINEYLQRFPEGTFKPEAILQQIQLLVALGQNTKARKLIQSASLQMPGKAQTLRELAIDLATQEQDCDEVLRLLRLIPAETLTVDWKTKHLRGCTSINGETAR